MEQQERSLRAQLHTFVGKEMRAEKLANMWDAPHHVEAHKKAKEELEQFLRENPSMEEHLEAVEEHFLKELYR